MRDLASVGGLSYRLVRKHAWTEMLGLFVSMFLGLERCMLVSVDVLYL